MFTLSISSCYNIPKVEDNIAHVIIIELVISIKTGIMFIATKLEIYIGLLFIETLTLHSTLRPTKYLKYFII